MKEYNPMLTNFDLKFMNDCVHECIASWHNHITAYIPLPEEKQKNFNKYMREYNGPILYYKKKILAERTELANNYNDSIRQDDIDYGRRDDGTLMYSIPDEIPVYDDGDNVLKYERWRPSMFMVFQVDDTDDRYYVRSIKDRIGQVLLTLMRYDGTTPNGINLNDIEVIERNEEDVLNINADERVD